MLHDDEPTDPRALLLAAADIIADTLGPAPICAKLRLLADSMAPIPPGDLSPEAVAARQGRAEDGLRAALTEALDAHQRLDDDDFLDTFIVVCRIGSTEVNSWYLTIENNEPRDVVIGLCRIGQRQTELDTESQSVARAVADRLA